MSLEDLSEIKRKKKILLGDDIIAASFGFENFFQLSHHPSLSFGSDHLPRIPQTLALGSKHHPHVAPPRIL